MQKIRKGCKKLAQKLSCMDTPVIPPVPPVRASSGSRGTGSSSSVARTPPHSSYEVGTARTPPRCSSSKGKGRAIEDDDEADDSDEDWDEEPQPGYGQEHHEQHERKDDDYTVQQQADEISYSQFGGAPLPTQGDEQVIKMNSISPQCYSSITSANYIMVMLFL